MILRSRGAKAPLLSVDLMPARVALNLRESGAVFPCKWCSVAEIYNEEYEWLKESATEISNIENKLTELEEKYPEIMQKSMDGDMSMPAGSDTSTPPDDGSMQKFPAFEGKDLDGNRVKSDELYLLHHGRHLCTSRLLGTGGFGKRHERDVQPP